jgi:phosphatidate cytidylyltransferase
MMKQRIVTGVIGGATFIIFLYYGGMLFASLISFLAIIGFFELIRMSKIKFLSLPTITGFVAIGLIMLPSFEGVPKDISLIVSFERILISVVLLLFLFIVTSKNRFTIEQAGMIVIGLIYIGVGFYYFVDTRSSHGFNMVIFILALIWTTDSGAYFTGKFLGRTKLWPAISPNKTIEGSLGGIVMAVAAALIFQLMAPLFESVTTAIIIAIIVSIVGQLGDLVESGIKRHFDVKDSGALLPGHGGVLDRFDSLLFVFPALYLLQLI